MHDEGRRVRLLLPLLATQEIDMDQMVTRDWLVPGEKAIVLIETPPSLESIESFSFYCTVDTADADDDNVADATTQRRRVDAVEICERLPLIHPTKGRDNRLVFPVAIQVPNVRASTFVVTAFSWEDRDSGIAALPCYSLDPFSVRWERFVTAESMIVQLVIDYALPKELLDSVQVVQTTLQFDESASDEGELNSSISITRAADTHCAMRDGECLRVSFFLRPLSDVGAWKISWMPLVFKIVWRVGMKEIVSSFPFSMGSETADLVISAPAIEAVLMRPTVMPIRVVNVWKRARNVCLCFGDSHVKPGMKTCTLSFAAGEEAKSMEFSFVPLVLGDHELEVWADVKDKRRVKPMFPLRVTVRK